MADQNRNEYEGVWYCGHWYPSNKHKGEDVNDFYAKAYQRGDELIVESLPNPGGSYLLLKLVVDGDLATGFWEETTSPTSEFAGAIYSGAVQLLISKDGQRMEGKWVGVGQDKGTRKIFGGKWEMHRAGSHEASQDKLPKKAM